jgi:hypothetical protein
MMISGVVASQNTIGGISKTDFSDEWCNAIVLCRIGTLTMKTMKTLPILCAGALLAGSAIAVAKPALDVTPLLHEVDRNHDGCMDHAEWQAAGLPESAYRILKDDKGCVTAAKMTTTPAPDGIDLNGDGKLTAAEFRAFDRKMSRPKR